MSITETRPEAAAEPPAPSPDRPAVVDWFTSADHKRIGVAYLYTSLLFAVVATVGALGAGIERLSDGLQLIDKSGDLQLQTLYLSATFFLFLAPAFLGFATYLVPLQIGARRIAFPRLHGFAYWLYLGGGAIVVSSYLVDGGPSAARSLIAPPGSALGGQASDLWVLGMGAVAVAAVLAAAGLVATLATMRAPGLTFERLPLFSWATLASSGLIALATPVFIAGLVLMRVNLHHGGELFTGHTGALIWQHVLWLHGRPELFALLVMGAGVVSEVVPIAARKPLPAYRPAQFMLGAAAVLPLLVWAFDHNAANAPLAPTFSIWASLAFAPLGLLLLLWLGSIAQGRPRPTAAFVFSMGFVLVLVAAGAGAVSGLVSPVRGGTAWAEGHLGLLFVAAPTFALAAASFYWAPKIWGRHLSEVLGYLQFLLLLGGAVLAFGPDYAGLRDFPRWSMDTSGDFTKWFRISFAGIALIVLSFVVFVANLAGAVWARRGRPAAADPWGGATLEWAAPSPPPPWNFEPDTLPEVRSEQPLLDVAAQAESEGES